MPATVIDRMVSGSAGAARKPVAVALVGVSGFAQVHYLNLLKWLERGRIRIVAATIINQAEEQEKCDTLVAAGCGIFDDFDRMLAAWRGKIDLCVIPTGIHLHAGMSIAALRAGCNVLLEKPAAATTQEVDAMIDAATAADRFLAIGFQHMYAPQVHDLKRAILDGLLGDVECIKCMGLWPRSSDYYERNNWAGRLRVNSTWVLDAPFSNAFAHWLNLLCFLAGTTATEAARPRSVEAELYRAREIESADTACLRIDAGIPLFLWVTHSCPENIGPVIEVRGTKGTIHWSHDTMLLRSPGKEELFRKMGPMHEMQDFMYQAVLGRASGGVDFICDPGIARNQTLCSNGAFESSPIHRIAPQFLDIDGTGLPRIDGIGNLFRTAFDGEKLLSTLGVEWARPGSRVDLESYPGFQIPRTEPDKFPSRSAA